MEDGCDEDAAPEENAVDAPEVEDAETDDGLLVAELAPEPGRFSGAAVQAAQQSVMSKIENVRRTAR